MPRRSAIELAYSDDAHGTANRLPLNKRVAAAIENLRGMAAVSPSCSWISTGSVNDSWGIPSRRPRAEARSRERLQNCTCASPTCCAASGATNSSSICTMRTRPLPSVARRVQEEMLPHAR